MLPILLLVCCCCFVGSEGDAGLGPTDPGAEQPVHRRACLHWSLSTCLQGRPGLPGYCVSRISPQLMTYGGGCISSPAPSPESDTWRVGFCTLAQSS